MRHEGSTPRVRKNIELLASSWWNTQQPGAKYLQQRHATCNMHHTPVILHAPAPFRPRQYRDGRPLPLPAQC